MADGPHYKTGEIGRREHNDVAMSKKCLMVLYNSTSDVYEVGRVNDGGALSVSDFFYEISAGRVSGNASISIIGANPSVGTGASETIWEEGGAYVFPTSASTMTVSSSDANDTSAGTGCRTILIQGLDTNYLEIQEFVSMNGQSAVTTSNSYLRINAMTCFTSGSSLENAGIIYIGTGTVTSGKPATVYGRVSAGEGISHSAVYTVPASKNFFLIRGSFGAASGKQVNLFIDSRPFTLGRTKVRGTTYSVAGQEIQVNFNPSAPFSQKTDIFVSAIATGGGGAGESRVNLAGILEG